MILNIMGGGNNSTESCKVRRAFKENKNKSLESRGRRCEYTGESSEYGSFQRTGRSGARLVPRFAGAGTRHAGDEGWRDERKSDPVQDGSYGRVENFLDGLKGASARDLSCLKER